MGQNSTYNGNGDAYITKVRADGLSLEYSGFLGGTAGDYGLSIAVNQAGEAAVAGATDSGDYPLWELTTRLMRAAGRPF